MKVIMNKAIKKMLSLEETKKAKQIIAGMKENEITETECIKKAICAACKKSWCIEVFKASAIITKNFRIYNAFFEGSGKLDIWISATAQTADGFMIIGAYLTDIWELTGCEEEDEEIINRMYIRNFLESKN